MPTTKKGLSTKDSILDAARSCFMKNGLEETTLSDICKKSKTNLGTLTYYFPKKVDIVSEVYKRYRENLAKYIDSKATFGSYRERYGAFVTLYYYQIYSNEKVRNFHHECMVESSMSAIFSDVRTLAAPIIFSKDDPDMDLLIFADNAIRREFNLHFYEKGDFSFPALKQLVRNIHIVNSRLYTVSKDEINDYLEKACTFVEEHLDCPVSLL
ncbi:MAG: TetR/AcrR family transcriptional regulator [Bacilli bacterium]|nr:TetR/AcrR family transcriptional regulator [Bacilli bacterium]